MVIVLLLLINKNLNQNGSTFLIAGVSNRFGENFADKNQRQRKKILPPHLNSLRKMAPKTNSSTMATTKTEAPIIECIGSSVTLAFIV